MKKNNVQLQYEKIMNDFKVIEKFPWEDKWSYGAWLTQTYFFVENSTQLIAHTGHLFGSGREAFRERFLEHANEEKGHEKLLTRDLKAIGYSLGDFEVYPETKAFYQMQYYWVERVNPMALFGYILTLEGIANHYGKPATARAASVFGAKGSNFLRVHSEEDEDHIAKALEAISQISPEEETAVLENLNLSSYFYQQMLEQILQHSSQKKKVA